MKKIILLAITFFMLDYSYSQTFDVNPKWQFGTYGNNLGEYLMKVLDIDNDNNNELIISSRYSKDSWDSEYFLYILKYSEQAKTHQFYWTSQIFNSKITATFFEDINFDEYQDILVGFENGSIQIIDGKSLKVQENVLTNRKTINSLIVGDADNDKNDEIIICDNDSITIYNFGFDVEIEIPYGGKDMEIGQIDSDDKNEIVLTSGKVIEVSENTFHLEEEFNAYNTRLLELHDFDKDNKLELIYQTGSSEISCYDFVLDTSAWKINTSSSLESMTIYRNPVNNIDKIYLGTTYDGINVYDALNGNFINKLPDHHEGVNNIAVGDVDNDSETELIWSDGADCTCEDYIFIHKLEDLTLEWKNFPLNGPFTAVDYGDIDNDGEIEVVVASESSGSHEGGVINVFNSTNGIIEWQSEPYNDDISSVKIADINKDGSNELLVGIEYTGLVVPATYLYIYETQAYEIDTSFRIYDSRRIRDIEVTDINNDLVNEIILSTGSGWSSDNCHIFILSGETKEILWQSDAFGGGSNYTYSLNISNIDNDPALEIIGIHYNYWGSDNGSIFIVDGADFSVQNESQYSYTCLTTGDYNSDNQLDIIAGTDYGEIIVLNGTDLQPINYLNTDSVKIFAIDLINNNSSILYSDGIKLREIDKSGTNDLWNSITINSSIGAFNNMIYSDLKGIDNPEVLVGSDHSVYLFSLSETETSNIIHKEKQQNILTYAYPNPCYQNTTIYLYSESEIDTKIEIYSINGELIYSQIYKTSIGENSIILPLHSLTQGTYIYKVFQDNSIVTNNKIIKL